MTDPTGRFLYATSSGNNTVPHYAIDANGNLSAVSSVAGQGITPVGIAMR